MSITFQKRQKELKRQEKQRSKAERREHRKAAKRAAEEAQGAQTTPPSDIEQQPRSENKTAGPVWITGYLALDASNFRIATILLALWCTRKFAPLPHSGAASRIALRDPGRKLRSSFASRLEQT